MMTDDGQWQNEVAHKIRTQLSILSSLWEKIGYNQAELRQVITKTETRLLKPLDSIISDSKLVQCQLIAEIDQIKAEITQIESELSIPPRNISTSAALIPLKDDLKIYNAGLQKRVDELTEEFKKLKNIEESLCSYLAEKSLVGFPLIPSFNDKVNVQGHIDQLKRIQNDRETKLSAMRERMLSCIKYLDSDYTMNLVGSVKSVIQGGKKPSALTDEFLSEIDQAQDSLLDVFHEYKFKEDTVLENIESLRNRLGLSPYSIPVVHSGAPSLRIRYGEQELVRLRELRLANLLHLTGACVLELEGVWNDCSVGTEYRQQFRDATPADTSEENLSRLEAEVLKWRHFKQNHQDFYDALTVWQDTLQQIKAIELKRQDPAVLKNRGGILLKLDKEDRKLRTRDLPNHTSHLEAIIARECWDQGGGEADSFSLVSIEGESLRDLKNQGMKENVLARVVEKSMEPLGGQTSALPVKQQHHNQSAFVYASSASKRQPVFTCNTQQSLQQGRPPLSAIKKPRVDYMGTRK